MDLCFSVDAMTTLVREDAGVVGSSYFHFAIATSFTLFSMNTLRISTQVTKIQYFLAGSDEGCLKQIITQLKYPPKAIH